MRYERFLIVLLVVALAVIDQAASKALLQRTDDWASVSSFHCTLSLALGGSQIALLTFYAMAPIGSAPIRIAVSSVVMFGVCMTLLMLPAYLLQVKFVQGDHVALAAMSGQMPLWIARGFLQALILSLPLVWLRLAGLKLIQFRAGVELPWPASESTLGRWQFSLGRLLAVLTAAAVLLGLLQYVLRSIRLPSDPRLWLFIVALCVGQAGIALAALWLALGMRRLPLRVAALAAACGAAIALHYPFVGSTPTASTGDYAMLCAMQAGLIVGPLLVFRVLGYRVAFRPRSLLPRREILYSSRSA